MKIEIIASGSSGNCYVIKNDDTTLLIECGIRFKEIQKHFKFQTSSIDACIVTHEHGDHSKAVKDVIKAGIDVYVTSGTREALGLEGHHRIYCFYKANDIYSYQRIGTFSVLPFRTIHDSAEPVGFYIMDLINHESLIFVTDTAYVLQRFPAVNYLMIECNYVQSIIDSEVTGNRVNLELRNRIVKNHLSMERLLDFLRDCDLSRIKAIYLLHLSNNNTDQQLIYREVAKLTGKQIYFS